MKSNLKWILLILGVTFLFFWKLTLTNQFSLLVWPEPANQAYSWYHFSAARVQQGTIPLWDPFTHAGRTFIGGMETGVFYPLKILLYLCPFNHTGLFSPRAFHLFYVLSHILAAWFLFFLARELGLRPFPSFVASLCFSLAGFMSKIAWPDMLDSAIWLPLILLLLLRAMNARRGRMVLFSCLSGIALGLSVLGGRIHIVMMDAFVILSIAAYLTWRQSREGDHVSNHRSLWMRSLGIVSIIAVIGILLGAIQLLPSIEYSQRAIRYIGADAAVQATEKIKYADLHGELWPRSLISFLLIYAFDGNIGSENFGPYFGVLPLILIIFGVWQNWHNVWVKYLASVAALSFAYSLSSFSFLHGLLYATVPYLWIMREACRLTYLMHFCMAILVGFGVQSLFETALPGESVSRFVRALWWAVAVITGALFVPAVYGKPSVNEWSYYSLFFILASVSVVAYIFRGHRTNVTAFVLAAVILSDLYGSYWMIRNIKEAMRSTEDYLNRTLLESRNVADFLKRQPGVFRVRMEADAPPNIGDLYGIQTTECMMATELLDYSRFRTEVPRAYDLLNVRFTVKRNSATDPGPVYMDGLWKVYENHSYFPRAWIVREAVYARSQDEAILQMKIPAFDPQRRAIVTDRLEIALEAQQNSPDEIKINSYQTQRIELSVQTDAPGLLVLSEVDYPGWQASVNGIPTSIHKANGLLRSVIVPAGLSKVVFRYAPRSVLWGAVFSCLAPLGTLGIALYVRRRKTVN